MKARGKREARRPWLRKNHQMEACRAEIYGLVLRPFRAVIGLVLFTRGDALRACPWLSYLAPLALFGLWRFRAWRCSGVLNAAGGFV